MAVRTAPTTRITRDDLEAKFRELEAGARDQAESAKTTIVTAGVIAAVIVLLLAFLLGRRAGKQRSTIVEIRRV
ncbi:MAG: hypothetical protein ACRDZN_09330 [Acidimicrobiales bacterium]